MNGAARSSAPFEVVADGLKIFIQLSPKASRSAVEGIAADADGQPILKVRVTARPAEGKANAALIKLLAKTWRLPAGSLSIAAGARDRRKVVHIAGDGERIAETLRAKLG